MTRAQTQFLLLSVVAAGIALGSVALSVLAPAAAPATALVAHRFADPAYADQWVDVQVDGPVDAEATVSDLLRAAELPLRRLRSASTPPAAAGWCRWSSSRSLWP